MNLYGAHPPCESKRLSPENEETVSLKLRFLMWVREPGEGFIGVTFFNEFV